MWKIIILTIFTITWIVIWYINYNKSNHYIPFSDLVSTKAMHWITPNWIITSSYYCMWTCQNYSSSSSSRWSSSFGGGK